MKNGMKIMINAIKIGTRCFTTKFEVRLSFGMNVRCVCFSMARRNVMIRDGKTDLQFLLNAAQAKLPYSEPQFMDDADETERDLALFMNIVILTKCSELWVFGEKISPGMAMEIRKAEVRGIPIRCFTTECEEVAH